MERGRTNHLRLMGAEQHARIRRRQRGDWKSERGLKVLGRGTSLDVIRPAFWAGRFTEAVSAAFGGRGRGSLLVQALVRYLASGRE
jgi:hypothetical protein